MNEVNGERFSCALGLFWLAAIASISLLLIPREGFAQQIYIDTNGDGVASSADTLNGYGVPTILSVYLNTVQNKDSTVPVCATGPESLTINSYELILHAEGGRVSYSAIANQQASMDQQLDTQYDDTDLCTGFAGGVILPPGCYHLCDITVSILSGQPSIAFATATSLRATATTSFGSMCIGQDGDNTLKLGLDWFDATGCSPAEGNQELSGRVPESITLSTDDPVSVVGEFSVPDTSRTLTVSASGLPDGLSPVAGVQQAGRRQLRIYGVPRDTTSATISWVATDGESVLVAHSTVHVAAALTPEEALDCQQAPKLPQVSAPKFPHPGFMS